MSFTFSTASGSSGSISFECALTSGDQKNTTAVFAACLSPVQYSGLADGQYQFYVRAEGEEIADSRAFTKVCVSPLHLFCFPVQCQFICSTFLAEVMAWPVTSVSQTQRATVCNCVTAVWLTPSGLLQDTTPPRTSFTATQPASDSSQVASLSWQSQDTTAVTYSCRLNSSSLATWQQPVHAFSPLGNLPGPPLVLGNWAPCAPPMQLYWLSPGATSHARDTHGDLDCLQHYAIAVHALCGGVRMLCCWPETVSSIRATTSAPAQSSACLFQGHGAWRYIPRTRQAMRALIH